MFGEPLDLITRLPASYLRLISLDSRFSRDRRKHEFMNWIFARRVAHRARGCNNARRVNVESKRK